MTPETTVRAAPARIRAVATARSLGEPRSRGPRASVLTDSGGRVGGRGVTFVFMRLASGWVVVAGGGKAAARPQRQSEQHQQRPGAGVGRLPGEQAPEVLAEHAVTEREGDAGTE